MKKGFLITLLIIGFILVRVVGKSIFYDPLIAFFHESDFSLHPLPEIEMGKYLISLIGRYALNTGLTIAMVYVVFKKTELIKFTAILYAIVFVVLVPVLLWYVFNAEKSQYQFLFYVRRMLIHPVLTLIYIPALLYHEHTLKLEKDD